MPRVGMRIIKSAIAVFLCFMVDLVRANGIVFYSVIAAILCMQPEISDTIKQAKVRLFATIVGGIAGMFFLLFETNFFQIEPQMLRYFVLSVMIIPLIYFNVLIKKPTAAYLTCVVFLSITVSHVNDVNPSLFAANRVMDTLIGIGIAYVINRIRFPQFHKQERLIVVDVDAMIKSKEVDGTFKYKFNQWLDRGIHLTIVSTKIYLMPYFKDIRLQLPFILLDGAISYDPKTNHYIHPIYLDEECVNSLRVALSSYHLFIYEYNLDKLVIHHQDFETTAQQAFYDRTHLAEFHFFYYHATAHQVENDVVVMMLIEPKSKLDEIQRKLKPYENTIRLLIEEEEWLNDAVIIRVISDKANREAQIKIIQEQHNLKQNTRIIKEENAQSLFHSIQQSIK